METGSPALIEDKKDEGILVIMIYAFIYACKYLKLPEENLSSTSMCQPPRCKIAKPNS